MHEKWPSVTTTLLTRRPLQLNYDDLNYAYPYVGKYITWYNLRLIPPTCRSERRTLTIEFSYHSDHDYDIQYAYVFSCDAPNALRLNYVINYLSVGSNWLKYSAFSALCRLCYETPYSLHGSSESAHNLYGINFRYLPNDLSLFSARYKLYATIPFIHLSKTTSTTLRVLPSYHWHQYSTLIFAILPSNELHGKPYKFFKLFRLV